MRKCLLSLRHFTQGIKNNLFSSPQSIQDKYNLLIVFVENRTIGFDQWAKSPVLNQICCELLI